MTGIDRVHLARAAAAVALVLAPLVAACGGDDEPAAQTETGPPLSVPGESTETMTEEATTEATTEPVAPPPPTEAPPPPPPPPPPADSPENDQPPPEDSPAERFEQYCDQYPDAC